MPDEMRRKLVGLWLGCRRFHRITAKEYGVPLASMSDINGLLACPVCGARLLPAAKGYRCDATAAAPHTFPLLGGVPVLVDFDTSVLDRTQLLRSNASSLVPRRIERWPWVKRALEWFSAAGNDSTAGRTLERILGWTPRPTILVVGGGTAGPGARLLYERPDVRVIAFDVYHSPLTQFVADAHAIPLQNATVDAVWVQAVLEHVLEPQRVVDEIRRVLRPEGFLLSEIPFMQQVHEAAFDFTRFTDLGQRWLFRRFEEVESGVVAGPGIGLAWSLDYFVRGLTRSRLLGRLVGFGFCWLGWLERLIPVPFARDAASCLYFVGRRSERVLTPREVVRGYRGAQ